MLNYKIMIMNFLHSNLHVNFKWFVLFQFLTPTNSIFKIKLENYFSILRHLLKKMNYHHYNFNALILYMDILKASLSVA